MQITVFGSSQPKPGQTAYTQAQKLGRLLGSAGNTVITGGYTGTMEAVSKGASIAGGYVIGVTCVEIENYRPIGPNPWVKEEIRTQTLMERLSILIRRCDAALSLPGGPGTLTEISLLWNHMVIGAIPQKPLILIGSGWRFTFQKMISSKSLAFSQHDSGLLQFAPTIQTAYTKLMEITHA